MSKKNESTNYIADTQVSENSKAILIMSKDLEYMKAGIDDIKESVKRLSKEVRGSYATKDDVKEIESKIEKYDSLIEWVLRIIVGALIVGILSLLGVKI